MKKKRNLLLTASPWISLSLSILLTLFLMSSPALDLFSHHQSSALALLQGYRTQYILILVVLSLGAVVTGIATIASIRLGKSFQDSVKLMLYAFLGSLVLLFGMGFGAHIPSTIQKLSADIAQITQNTTEKSMVWLSPNSYPTQLTDLVGAKTVTRYAGMGTGDPIEFYVPHALGFSPDTNTLFDERRSISWNEEHTPRYEITYTSHFRLVVSVQRAA